MTTLPDENEIRVVTTKSMRLELNEDHVREIIKDWAESRGFSHRVEIQIDCADNSFIRSVTLFESVSS